MKKIYIALLSLTLSTSFFACQSEDDLKKDIEAMNAKVDELSTMFTDYNQQIAALQEMVVGKVFVKSYTTDDISYTLELSNGTKVRIYNGSASSSVPVITIGTDGYWYVDGVKKETATPGTGKTPQVRIVDGKWQYSFDGETWTDAGPALPGTAGVSSSNLFTAIAVDEPNHKVNITLKDGSQLTVPYGLPLDLVVEDGTKVVSNVSDQTVHFDLGETKTFKVTQTNVKDIVIEPTHFIVKISDTSLTLTAPETNVRGTTYQDKINLKIVSQEGYVKLITIKIELSTTAASPAVAWTNFNAGSTSNVLLDFSYAGYNHGESAPTDVYTLGYAIANVKDTMNTYHLSARDALIRILDEREMIRKSNLKAAKANAKVIIYFPHGEYILQDANEVGEVFPFDIIAGNFVIKGDGADQTRLVFKQPNGSGNDCLPFFSVKHTNSPYNNLNSPLITEITDNAKKGEFTVRVKTTNGLKVGKWVQLKLRSGNQDLLHKELGPIPVETNWNIAKAPIANDNTDKYGIKVTEFHQIKAIVGNEVTFYEPIMHEINTAYDDGGGWQIREYKYFENVGVEDLTFVGNSPTAFKHHADGNTDLAWWYDFSFRPLMLGRLVNSWVRNVNFENVSEALTFFESANCSAYNIQINGRQGHAAVRAQGSSRIFIGNVRDNSGQFHGCGSTKPSIGTVVWNCTWGNDCCFEAHATQPRATLYDICSGGLNKYHSGGDDPELPNHLADLTIWNLHVTQSAHPHFNWFDDGKWWKFYPPIIVGVYGSGYSFTNDSQQFTYTESLYKPVAPHSLYEAQLALRLGFVPQWLMELK